MVFVGIWVVFDGLVIADVYFAGILVVFDVRFVEFLLIVVDVLSCLQYFKLFLAHFIMRLANEFPVLA